MSCGPAHSSARELVAQGKEAKLVAETLAISRSSLYYRRHHGLVLNGKRVLRVMRERGLLVRQRRFQVSRRKDWGKVEALRPNHVWQSDMTKVWAGPSVG